MFTMYAIHADGSGSVAEMALAAESPSEARADAKEWLNGYVHDFSVAVWASDADISKADLATAETLHAWILKRAESHGNLLYRVIESHADLPIGETFTATLADVLPGDYVKHVNGWSLVVARFGEFGVRYESGGSESGYPYGMPVHRPTAFDIDRYADQCTRPSGIHNRDYRGICTGCGR
jgi:hypothetical protein